MLNNLRNVYLKQESWPELLAIIERLRILQRFTGHLRDLGLLHHQMGSLRLAASSTSSTATVADASDAEMVRNLKSVVDAGGGINDAASTRFAKIRTIPVSCICRDLLIWIY
jgi:regulator of sirC expression with transglutaminase-like and TPR domain